MASATLLKSQQLLATVALVMNLGCCLDKVLQMGTGEEVAEIDEFAVVLVLDVDRTPSVLTAAHLATIDIHGLLAANDGERNDGLDVVNMLYIRRLI